MHLDLCGGPLVSGFACFSLSLDAAEQTLPALAPLLSLKTPLPTSSVLSLIPILWSLFYIISFILFVFPFPSYSSLTLTCSTPKRHVHLFYSFLLHVLQNVCIFVHLYSNLGMYMFFKIVTVHLAQSCFLFFIDRGYQDPVVVNVQHGD